MELGSLADIIQKFWVSFVITAIENYMKTRKERQQRK